MNNSGLTEYENKYTRPVMNNSELKEYERQAEELEKYHDAKQQKKDADMYQKYSQERDAEYGQLESDKKTELGIADRLAHDRAKKDAAAAGKSDDWLSYYDKYKEEEFSQIESKYEDLKRMVDNSLSQKWGSSKMEMVKREQQRQDDKAAERAKSEEIDTAHRLSTEKAAKENGKVPDSGTKSSTDSSTENGGDKGSSSTDSATSTDGASGNSSTPSSTTTTKEQKTTTRTGAVNPVVSGLRSFWDRKFGKTTDPMGRSTGLRAQADLHNVEAGEHRAAAQRENQIANRDPRREAGLDGAAEYHDKNAQKVNNRGNVSAGAAALEREEGYGNPDTHRNRADQARQKGVENTEKAYDEDQVAIQERTSGDVYDYVARDMQSSNDETNALSQGSGDNTTKTETKTETKTPEPEKTDPPKPTVYPEEKTATLIPQWALNYITYSKDPMSKQNPDGKGKDPFIGMNQYNKGKEYATTQYHGDNTWNDKVASEAQPISPEDIEAYNKKHGTSYNPQNYPGEGEMQNIVAELRPNWYKWWKGVSGRFDDNGHQKNLGDVVDGKVVGRDEIDNKQTNTYTEPIVDAITGPNN